MAGTRERGNERTRERENEGTREGMERRKLRDGGNGGGQGNEADARPRSTSPVESCMRVIKGKHKPAIIIRLGRGTRRFSELRRAIPGVSERMLAKQLQELERDGVVGRTVFPEVPPRVEYCLTSLGTTLCPIIEQMWYWGKAHGDLQSRK